MSIQQDSAALRGPAVPKHRSWLRLVVGIISVGVGVAAFAWPGATVRVISLEAAQIGQVGRGGYETGTDINDHEGAYAL